MLSSPFDTVVQRIRDELREAVRHEVQAYQWIESKKGRALTLRQAWTEWNEAHREDLARPAVNGPDARFNYFSPIERRTISCAYSERFNTI
jgi:hypothetical protein